MKLNRTLLIRLCANVLVFLPLLYLSARVYLSGNPLTGSLFMLVAALAFFVFNWTRGYNWRYLFPGLLGFGLFVILPIVYTVYISFTNFSSVNLLTYDKVVQYFKEETYLASDVKYSFTMHPAEGGHVLVLRSGDQAYVSPPLALPHSGDPVALQAADPQALPAAPALALRDIVALRAQLQNLALALPDGTVLNNTGLRDFGPRHPLYTWDPAGDSFTNVLTGEKLVPWDKGGFFVKEASLANPAGPEKVGPGYRVVVGLDNYTRVLTDKGIQGPFIKIFIWTVIFALGSVLLSLTVGMVLAVLLEWKDLHYRKLYRTMLILPYAVPAFISILIFKGLFNQNFGEINFILSSLFGIKPEWFADPLLAKIMILVVNTWLGFPYMMIVCTGILQSVPDTIYEASAIDGSNAWHDFFKLTLPLIFPPLFPLLVASFAFNFNNFLLIYLLTGGGPDIVGATVIAGETDILVSYTFRVAFQDAGKNFGYASAIATIIFIIVALISWWNLRNQKIR